MVAVVWEMHLLWQIERASLENERRYRAMEAAWHQWEVEDAWLRRLWHEAGVEVERRAQLRQEAEEEGWVVVD